MRNYVFDFTHCYKEHYPHLQYFDCSDIEGTRLFCEKKAEDRLKSIIKENGISGIHFIDSGDYHYITKFMTDFIKEPFDLVLIDHHTDMQSSIVGDMLSCGNWAKKVLSNPYLHQLYLIGPEKHDLRSVENQSKVIDISIEELEQGCSIPLETKYPVYISIDKDVLSEKYAITNWNQGDMSLGMLENVLAYFLKQCEVIGIDICGDDPEMEDFPEYIKAERINSLSDEALYKTCMKILQRRKRV